MVGFMDKLFKSDMARYLYILTIFDNYCYL